MNPSQKATTVNMDITAFSAESFDTKAWINKTLKQMSQQDNNENHVMSLVMKLQLYVQQVNSALEETSQRVLQTLPKVMYDTKNLHQEALLLREKMQFVKQEVAKIESDSEKSMESLEYIDNLITQLKNAKQSLHESDNWSALATDLEELFDAKNVEKIAANIQQMQGSLKMLRNVGDYDEKKLHLEGLKNRLEATASPFIVQAFTSVNVEQSKMYVKIFSSIERLPQLLKYYHKCQKASLLQKWQNQMEIEQDENVIQTIHNFYDILLSNWHTQAKWFNCVFTNQSAVDTLILIYTDVLNTLYPSMNDCLENALKQHTNKLSLLIEVKMLTKEFENNLYLTIEQSHENSNNKKLYFTLSQTIYRVVAEQVKKYPTYEQSYLSQQLSSMNCARDDITETVKALSLTAPAVMDLAREAKKRCQKFTENCGYCGFLMALKTFLSEYLDKHRSVLLEVKKAKAASEDNWGMFHLCFLLLECVGNILVQLQTFEKDIMSGILEHDRTGVNEVDFKDLFLQDNQLEEFNSLLKCVTEGTELSLLDSVLVNVNNICSDIYETTYQVLSSPIAVEFNKNFSKIWDELNKSKSSADLPDYGFTPQEYITQIGQYLMTLPQHLEPFLLQDNLSLSSALRAADPEYQHTPESEGAITDAVLTVIAKGTCDSYCDRILNIAELSPGATKQLANDINYLSVILDDLGLSMTENLQQILTLLRLTPEQYQSQSTGCSPRYVAAVRQMRNLTSGF